MSAKTSNRVAKRKRRSKGRMRYEEQVIPDDVPSDFMSEADRNQGVARPDPFDDMDVAGDKSFEAPKGRGSA